MVSKCAIEIEEEGGAEYASYHSHTGNGKQEAHLEPAVLYQPLEVSADLGLTQGDDMGNQRGMESVSAGCTLDCYPHENGHSHSHTFWNWVTSHASARISS